MSAVDVPLYAGLGGRLAGEFAARPGAQTLARLATRWVVLGGLLAVAIANRRQSPEQAGLVVVMTMTLSAVAGVGLAVRRARVAVDPGGVRWGWDWLSVRLERDDIRRIDVYDDAIAFRQRRGSTWFLTAWDWDRFDALVLAVERAGLPTFRNERRAPLGARLQSYGRVLDGLLVISMLGASALVVMASLL